MNFYPKSMYFVSNSMIFFSKLTNVLKNSMYFFLNWWTFFSNTVNFLQFLWTFFKNLMNFFSNLINFFLIWWKFSNLVNFLEKLWTFLKVWCTFFKIDDVFGLIHGLFFPNPWRLLNSHFFSIFMVFWIFLTATFEQSSGQPLTGKPNEQLILQQSATRIIGPAHEMASVSAVMAKWCWRRPIGAHMSNRLGYMSPVLIHNRNRQRETSSGLASSKVSFAASYRFV